MNDLDLILGMDASVANRAVAQLHGRSDLRSRLFQGSEAQEFQGVSGSGSWDIQSAPQVEFRPPNSAEWSQAVKADGGATAPQQNAFLVHLPRLTVSITALGSAKSDTIDVTALCAAQISGTRLSVSPLGLMIPDLTRATPFDQFFYRAVIIPKVLATVNSMLSNINVAPPTFEGVSLTAPAIAISNGKLIVAFNLSYRDAPLVADSQWPSDSNFILTSRRLLEEAANRGAERFVEGKDFNQTGSEGGSGFSAEYRVWGRVGRVNVSATSDPTILNCTMSFGLSASAGVNVLGGIVGGIVDAGNVIGGGIVDAAEETGKAIKNIFSGW